MPFPGVHPVQSALYEAEHEAFRASIREFLAKEVVPHHAAWEEAGVVDRGVWQKAGAQGLLGMDVPEEFGGGGVKDFRYNAIVAAEVTRVGASGLGFALHNDVVAPYLVELATDEQKARWLPGFVRGESLSATPAGHRASPAASSPPRSPCPGRAPAPPCRASRRRPAATATRGSSTAR